MKDEKMSKISKAERKNSVPSWVGPTESPPQNLTRPGDKTISDWQYNWESKFPIVAVCRRWDAERVKRVRTNKVIPIVAGKKKRRIRIEIRRQLQNTSSVHGDIEHGDVENGLLSSDWSDIIADGDIILVKIMKKDKDSGETTSDGHSYSRSSSGSVSTIGFRGVEDDSPHDAEGWLVIDMFLISMMTVVKRENSKCTTLINRGNSIEEEHVYYFTDYQTAKSLETFVTEMKELVVRNAANVLQTIGINYDSSSTLKLFVEIVSATNLRALDGRRTDPYVIAYHGGDEVHRTSVIRDNCDPIWTVLSKSYFILTIRLEEICSSELILEVNEDEIYSSESSMGQVIIDNRTLLKANGERMEFPLRRILSGEDAKGYLVLRIRQASDEDPTCIKSLQRSGDTHSQKIQAKYIRPPHPNLSTIKRRKRMVGEHKYHLARPCRSVDDETWMTSREIEACAYEDSEYWVEAGSGELGSLYIEIIGCDILSNLDVNRDSKSKPHAFGSMIFEDVMISTDVVLDSFSPRFLPWTRRAMKAHIRHASSQIFLGVFGYDGGQKKANDPMGRCAISLEKFASNTVYVLSYDLFKASQEGTRKRQGSITIRLRIDWKSQRSGFNALRIPEILKINVTDKKDFQTASFITQGKIDVNEYSVSTILSHVAELQDQLRILSNIENALKNLLFWRGHHEVSICCCRIKLPLHSIVLFSFSNVYLEYPELGLSLFFASIAWFMLALLENQHRKPSQWSHSPSYSVMLLRLILGMNHAASVKQNKKCVEDDAFFDNMEDYELVNRDHASNILHAIDLLDKEEASKRDVLDVKKDMSAFSSALYQDLLHPWQTKLINTIYYIRFARDILTWERTYLSFWITTIAIIFSIMFSILAYLQIILWVKRIFVWIFLGPGMILFDKCYFSKVKMPVNEYEGISGSRVSRRQSEYLKAQERRIREEKERMVKDEAIREQLYGKYILSVPNMKKSERFQSIPRTESFSYPFKKADKEKMSSIIYEKIEGQRSLSIPTGQNNFIDLTEDDFSTGSAITFAEKNPLMARSVMMYKSLDE